jgi:Fe-S cluster biogenesis protein NfuA
LGLRKHQEKKMSEKTLREQVDETLQGIRPYLRGDGGDVELVDVSDEGVVSVRLVGACHGCPGAIMTLRMGIERILRERVPGVTGVEAV